MKIVSQRGRRSPIRPGNNHCSAESCSVRHKKPVKLLIGLVVGVLLILNLATWPASATGAAGKQTQEEFPRLRVLTKEIEPFVIMQDGNLVGFSIDYWNEIARLTGLEFEFIEVETIEELLAGLQNGEGDLAIAAISMTAEREEVLDFSYPYYRSGLQIITYPVGEDAFFSGLSFLYSKEFLAIVGSLFLIVLIYAHILWLTERRNNPDFPNKYLPGIWESIWYAAVTVTSVGYGDKTPISVFGRILGIVWMFAGLFIVAAFTASVAAQYTVAGLSSPIERVEDLHDHTVATVRGSSAADYLDQQNIRYRGYANINDALRILVDGNADAIVFDEPVLAYYAATYDSEGNAVFVGEPFKTEDYGIAFPTDSPYEEAINKAILELFENGTHAQLKDKWFVESN